MKIIVKPTTQPLLKPGDALILKDGSVCIIVHNWHEGYTLYYPHRQAVTPPSITISDVIDGLTIKWVHHCNTLELDEGYEWTSTHQAAQNAADQSSSELGEVGP